MADFDFPDDLIELERSAWEAIQAGNLTVEQATAVQAGVTAFAAAAGVSRYTAEMALKKAVRHAEPEE
ncbi:hypothetical protein MQE23_08315 [Streptomyces sp. HP-A2021]|uniref:hypothetical protein n=1 Tax=Streptomyces sp. HP-A2021 TaxID=2927875 RepID=UPI001FAEBCBF|nr:hypothetical protein [Streptomyces sp. HP-A2021]UOB09054.1 hypothetical protein MQE23_08315 [Streptomyces sp. HP-A2021]